MLFSMAMAAQGPWRSRSALSEQRLREVEEEVFLRFRGARFPIRGKETLIGRSANCQVVIPNKSTSREHAVIYREASKLMVKDLGSRNRTLVNGRPLNTPRQLNAGDQIRIGGDVLEVEIAPRGELKARGQHTVDEDQDSDVNAAAASGDSTDSLELLEMLMQMGEGADPEHREGLLPRICEVIEDRLEWGKRNGFQGDEGMRLAQLVQTVASWSSDASLTHWRDRIIREVGI